MSISPYNPEYNAKPWLAKLPTAGGQGSSIQTNSVSPPVVTTQGWGENRAFVPTGFGPIRKPFVGNTNGFNVNNYRSPLWDFINNWVLMSRSYVNFSSNPAPTGQEVDPYSMVQNPWL